MLEPNLSEREQKTGGGFDVDEVLSVKTQPKYACVTIL